MDYVYRFNIDQYRRIARTIAGRSGSRPITVLEVGSRDAADAFFLLSLLPKRSRIVCFDPHPLFPLLSKPFTASPALCIENVALSEKAGQQSFYMTNTVDLAEKCDDMGIGASSLKKPIANLSGLPTTGFAEVTVNCLRGDEYCVSKNILPDAIILDVQGAEVEVLKSFGDVLDSTALIFTECNIQSGVTYEGDAAAVDLISYLQSRGFSLCSAYDISRYSADLIFSRGHARFLTVWARLKVIIFSGLRRLILGLIGR